MFNGYSLFCLPRKLAGPVLVALIAISCASPAYAILINYQFVGSIGTGTLDSGDGPVSLNGQPFTATGMIVSEKDLNASPLLGLFGATTTSDFGTFGSFVSDSGEDFFLQFENLGATQFGLVNSVAREGLFPTSLPSLKLFADPNVPEAVGQVHPNINITFPRTQTNLRGDKLTIISASITTVETTAGAVPEPTTLLLLGLGLAGLGFARKWLH